MASQSSSVLSSSLVSPDTTRSLFSESFFHTCRREQGSRGEGSRGAEFTWGGVAWEAAWEATWEATRGHIWICFMRVSY
eukprot:1749910-Prymnesium_polylepis.1